MIINNKTQERKLIMDVIRAHKAFKKDPYTLARLMGTIDKLEKFMNESSESEAEIKQLKIVM